MVINKPFPYIVIRDALDSDLAAKLTNEFPLHLYDLNQNNRRLDLSAYQVEDNINISSHWREFIRYHTSKNFYLNLLEIFKDFFNNNSYNHYRSLTPLVRGKQHNTLENILLDAQISINTPVNKSSQVRGVHTDNTNKLFSGLFYLRKPGDESKGGDLEIYKWKDGYNHSRKILKYKEGLNNKHCELVKTIKYQNNLAIFFLNSLDSLHAVTTREPTEYPRCFVNFVGELDHDIFKKHNFFRNIIFRLRNRSLSLID